MSKIGNVRLQQGSREFRTPTNKWIFKNDKPGGPLDLIAQCYGDSCPMEIQRVKLKSVAVIPYFNFIENSFILLSANQNEISPLGEDQMPELFKSLEVIGVTDVVWDKNNIILFLEYRQLPAPLANNKLVLIQYSMLIQGEELLGFPLSNTLSKAMKYFPEKL